MDIIEIIAQAVGLAALAVNALSYQIKRKERILFCHFMVCLLYCINFFMLGAVVGGLTNLIGLLRSLVYMNRERWHGGSPLWLASFIVMYVLAFVLSFTVFGQEASAYNLTFGVIRIIGAVLFTVGYHLNGAKNIRRFALITAPMFLVYAISEFSIGAILTEILKMISTIIGIVRFDIKKQEEK